MSNKDFYELLLEHQSKGLLTCLPKNSTKQGFLCQRVGKRFLYLHESISDFADDICEKNEDGDFFSQRQLEVYLGKSHGYVDGQVKKGRFVVFCDNGVKFYIQHDWE